MNRTHARPSLLYPFHSCGRELPLHFPSHPFGGAGVEKRGEVLCCLIRRHFRCGIVLCFAASSDLNGVGEGEQRRQIVGTQLRSAERAGKKQLVAKRVGNSLESWKMEEI